MWYYSIREVVLLVWLATTAVGLRKTTPFMGIVKYNMT